MTTVYNHRTEDGQLKTKITAAVMARVTSTCPGKWRPYTAKGKPESACYEITDDMAIDAIETVGFKLYFWKGDIIVPVD